MAVNKHFSTIKKCRISESSDLTNILHLGNQPLANSLKKNANHSEAMFPLSISYCPDSSLLQLNETVDKEVLFEHYLWVTGTSEIARNYADYFANRVVEIADLDKQDLVVEIASNDGTFLKPFLNL